MTNLYIFSRKIHRILVLIISTVGILMAMSGILLKYTFIATKFTFIDLGMMRFVHNNLSPVFSVVFLGMLLTGFIMYLFSMLRNK